MPIQQLVEVGAVSPRHVGRQGHIAFRGAQQPDQVLLFKLGPRLVERGNAATAATQGRLHHGRADHRAAAEARELLHHPAELAHVARPGRGGQQGQRLRREAEGGAIGVTVAVIVQRLTGQQGDVLAAGAQRRQGDVGHVEAVEEILAKTPLFHGGHQILMAGADDPHLGGTLTILRQHLEQLGLE